MLAVLGITFPIYAVIALGYLTVRGGLFRPAEMRVLGGYVMNIALPALLFNAVASRDVNEVFNLSYMLVYLLGGLGTIFVASLWFAATGIAPLRRAVAVMGTACPNSGFVGYPMLLLALPAVAEQTLALNMLVENFLLIPLLLAMIELARSGTEAYVLRKIGMVLLGVLRRPMVLALMAGLLVSLAGVAVPAPVARLLAVLSASASALSLYVIGGALVGVPLRGNRAVALQIVIGKLLVQPACTAVILVALVSLGFAPLGPEQTAAVILSAAMPMFGIYTIFAQEAGHEGMASIAQLTATILAFFTLNGLLVWLV